MPIVISYGSIVRKVPGNSSSGHIHISNGYLYRSFYYNLPSANSKNSTVTSIVKAPKTVATASIYHAKPSVSTSVVKKPSSSTTGRKSRRYVAISTLKGPKTSAVSAVSSPIKNATAGSIVKKPTSRGIIILPPKTLYCNNSASGAHDGVSNPNNISCIDPHFSCLVGYIDSNITEVRVQVSAAGDSGWSEDVNWDSGWLTLETELSAPGRIEDIVYGALV